MPAWSPTSRGRTPATCVRCCTSSSLRYRRCPRRAHAEHIVVAVGHRCSARGDMLGQDLIQPDALRGEAFPRPETGRSAAQRGEEHERSDVLAHHRFHDVDVLPQRSSSSIPKTARTMICNVIVCEASRASTAVPGRHFATHRPPPWPSPRCSAGSAHRAARAEIGHAHSCGEPDRAG